MTPIETLDLKKIQSLRSLLKGELLLPDDHAFALASQAWNLNARQHPALVIMAETKEDIIAGVHFAHDLKNGQLVLWLPVTEWVHLAMEVC